MTYEELSFVHFAVQILEGSQRMLKRATGGLNDEQVYYQPSPGANSIGWLVWHLSRWKDRFGALATGEAQVWVGEGWAERFGIDAERTGLGDTPEQVEAFRVEQGLLFGYTDAAHEATMVRMSWLTSEQLLKPFPHMGAGNERPMWQAMVGMAMDFSQHTGQCAYLRGLITGPGWLGA